MKKTILILALFIGGKIFSQNADAVVGTWLTTAGKAQVQIYKENGKYSGKIIWLKEPNYADGTPKVNKNSPDASQRKNPVVGLVMLKGFLFVEDHWQDGTIYDPENGKTYSCKMTLNGNNLDVRGFIGFSLLGRTETWTKLK